ncbi:MAG: hypothetical protein N2508_00695 [Anaerolineae bacterium]|nr:hypothetical protein [Anaerolineae bacterium]
MKRSTVIPTGEPRFDSVMRGGLFLAALTLIEGEARTGKSVLIQKMMYGCLIRGYKLALFTTESTVKGLIEQMQNLNLEIKDYLLLGRLRIFPVSPTHPLREMPALLLQAIRREARERGIVFVDSLTPFIAESSESEILAFFEECKILTHHSAAIVVVIHSYGLHSALRSRLHSLCETHLRLRTDEVGGRLVRVLEVMKTGGMVQYVHNTAYFEIEPRRGVVALPVPAGAGYG